MHIILFFFLNLIVAASAFIFTYKVFRLAHPLDSLICWFITYISQIILIELILGILEILYIKNLIFCHLGILGMVWFFTKNYPLTFSVRNLKREMPPILHNKIIYFGTCVVLGFSLPKIFINLINPPSGWDSLNYHFTFPVEWLKHGALDTPITISDDPSPTYYPINGSLFYLWLMLPFRNVFLANLGQVPFFIVTFFALFNICRKINLDNHLSFYSAVLFLLIPNFFKQLQIAYVDIMVAALFLISVNFIFSLEKNFSWQNTLFYSLSMGLLLGTKTTALPYAFLLYIPFIYLLCKNTRRLYFIPISILIIIASGGFTYIRNFVDTGNPLYPLDFQLFGRTIFKGVMDSTVYRAHFSAEDYRLSKLLFHEGLGAQTLIFIIPSMIIALPFYIIKIKKNLNLEFSYFLMLPMFVYLIYRFVIPLANTRYLYPLLGTGMAVGFYTAKILNIPKRIILGLTLISITASMTELAKRQELIAAVIVTFLLLFFLSPVIKYIQYKVPAKSRTLLICSSAVFMICSLIVLEKYYIKNEYPGYTKMIKYSGFWPDAADAWNWLNKNTTGNNIAYIGRPVPFPLYGTNFKNNVFYVSVNRTEPAKLHYFSHSRYQWGYDFISLHENLQSEGNYRSRADYSVWLSNLATKHSDYLFVYSLHQTKEILFPLEDAWAAANPNTFIPVFRNSTIHIYKIFK